MKGINDMNDKQTKQTSMKRISHIAIAVKDLDEAIRNYTENLGFEFHGTEIVADQKVTTAFLSTEAGEHIELLCPTSEDSPISKFLEKRGEGIHHIAFFVEDIEKSLSIYKEKGIRLIDEAPRKGANNLQIAFLHPKATHGALIELSK